MKTRTRKTNKTTNSVLASAPKTPDTLDLVGSADVDFAAASDGKAKEPTFSMLAYSGGPMRLSGWYRPVVVDLSGMRLSASTTILLDHDSSQIVGQGKPKISGGKLTCSGVITGDVEDKGEPAGKVAAHARRGFKWSCSIGAGVEQVESVAENQTAKANGKTFKGPIYIVRASRLAEISFVGTGADEGAEANVAAAHDKSSTRGDIMNFEQWLESKGFVRASLSDEQLVSLQAWYDSEQGNEPAEKGDEGKKPKVKASADDTEPKNPKKVEAQDQGQQSKAPKVEAQAQDIAAQMRQDAAAEMERIQAIRKICGDDNAEIAAKAIKENWDATRTELEILRAQRPKAPAVRDGAANTPAQGQVLEAACMLSGGVRADDLQGRYEDKAIEAAMKNYRGGLGLQELLLEAAWANGYTGRTFRDTRGILRAAFGDARLTAGFSNVDIGGILSNVANKFLLDGFMAVERVWREICAVRSVNDFKTVTSYRLIGDDQYELVGPTGEIKHGTLGEESFSNKIDTYAKMLAVTRQAIMNDDLGAITTAPRKLGRGSGLKINDVFWRVFMANSAFFKTANLNYLAGADTVLGIDSLSKAEQMFMDQKDGDGKPIGIAPSILLVPTALSAIATALYKSLEIRDTTSSTKYPVGNVHASKYEPKVSRYLSNSTYTGHSSKAWHLLANPQDLPVIEVAFLNGQESPTIETAEADFNTLGVQMRGVHDFGVALQDYRGGVKMKGEA